MNHLIKAHKQVKLMHYHVKKNVKKGEGITTKSLCTPSVGGKGVVGKEPTRLVRRPLFNIVHFGCDSWMYSLFCLVIHFQSVRLQAEEMTQ